MPKQLGNTPCVIDINGESFGALRFFESRTTIKVQFVPGKEPMQTIKYDKPFDLVIWVDMVQKIKGTYTLDHVKGKELTFREVK